MSTRKTESPLEQALANVPAQFRKRLITTYEQLKRNQSEGRDVSIGQDAGKFCEVVVRLIQHATTASFTPFGTRITNFADECRKLVASPAASAPEALRVVVPRALVFMYTMRSKRGIGHVGGDVEANRIDAATFARVADWVVCELIRIYHSLSLEEAQEIVDGLAIRHLPDIWEVDGKRRVLRPGLSASQEALLILYADPTGFVLVEDLCEWGGVLAGVHVPAERPPTPSQEAPNRTRRRSGRCPAVPEGCSGGRKGNPRHHDLAKPSLSRAAVGRA